MRADPFPAPKHRQEPDRSMPSRKFGLNLVVLVALAALLTGVWALYNRPVSAPDWPA